MIKSIAAISLLIFLFSCQGNTDNSNTTPLPASGIAEPKNIQYSILNAYPHDTSSFTEGLEMYKGKLYESAGLPGRSFLLQTDLTTGKILKSKKLDTSYFAEGITILNDTLYQLTYQNHVVLVYNLKDFSLVRKMNWSNEGWGMTNDGTNLILSDGTDKIYYVRPRDFKLLKVISVTDNLGPVNNVNELEFVNGILYANRWQYPYLMKIDPATGNVIGRLDFTDTLEKYSKTDLSYLKREGSAGAEHGHELNGIAWDSTGKKLLVTGKLWPTLFEVRVTD